MKLTASQESMVRRLEAYGYIRLEQVVQHVWVSYNQATDTITIAQALVTGDWQFTRHTGEVTIEPSSGYWYEATDQRLEDAQHNMRQSDALNAIAKAAHQNGVDLFQVSQGSASKTYELDGGTQADMVAMGWRLATQFPATDVWAVDVGDTIYYMIGETEADILHKIRREAK